MIDPVRKEMNGVVNGRVMSSGTIPHVRYYVVTCPEGPPHLRTLNLVPSQMAGAKLGDRVVVAYQTTSRSGLWNVVEVIKGELAE